MPRSAINLYSSCSLIHFTTRNSDVLFCSVLYCSILRRVQLNYTLLCVVLIRCDMVWCDLICRTLTELHSDSDVVIPRDYNSISVYR